jgi:uncharacterized membrane protein YdbT with pleckstrin-like domain
MSYVQHVLQPGEIIRHQTKLHWMVYVPGLLLLILAGAVFWFAPSSGSGWDWNWATFVRIVGLIVLAAAAVVTFMGWFKQWTTEIAVTDRRIIFKRGFVRRHTIEMHLDKVESVDVDQSILGRIMNYGDLTVRGVGIGLEPLKNIDNPIDFRNHVTATQLAPTPVTPASSPAAP